jgi:hypothetical protein
VKADLPRILRWVIASLLLSIISVAVPAGAYAAPTSTDFALTFNGINQYASVANQQIIPTSLAATFTVEAWVYITSANPQYGTIVSQGGDPNQFYLKYSGGSFIMYRNGWSGEYNCGPGVLNSWTHIAVVIGTTAQTCYIDGQLSASFSNNTPSSIGNNYFMIGQWSQAISNSSPYFGGQVDEVKIWSTDRSASIQTDMQTYNPNASGLTAYYDFNEGSGSTLYNRATGANSSTNLAFTGAPIYVGVESSTVVNGDQVITFPRTYLNSSGGWQIPNYVTSIKSLVVAGGGAGGSRAGGGGGAGGFIYDSALSVSPNSFQSIVVGPWTPGRIDTQSANGSNSSLGTLRIALGGGGGGGASGSDNSQRKGQDGGSGGGASGDYSSVGSSAAIGNGIQFSTYGYGSGKDGGSGYDGGGWAAGGGGGTNLTSGTGTSSSASGTVAGKGGSGNVDPIAGTATCYATGGGGGINQGYPSNFGAGGDCGGSSSPNNNSGTAGAVAPNYPTANTGAGGGGAGYNNSGNDSLGGAGASGVIILRYALNMSVSLSYSGGTTAIYRTAGTITATNSLPGKVTFYEHGKAIPGCKSVAMNGSNIATYTWKPSLHGSTSITATAKPSNTYVPNGSTSLNIGVAARTGER